MCASKRRLTTDRAENLDHARELIPLERNAALLGAELDLGLLALEHRSQTEELSVDTPDRPDIDRRRVVACSEEKLGRAVPDGDDNL